mmetsp:Transcript_76401/g.111895  ORF Transcript_76401/g.111895 Transcript_76401/m.111895 type:complete len:84 (+) Transcript_76401:1081-1332(+)
MPSKAHLLPTNVKINAPTSAKKNEHTGKRIEGACVTHFAFATSLLLQLGEGHLHILAHSRTFMHIHAHSHTGAQTYTHTQTHT